MSHRLLFSTFSTALLTAALAGGALAQTAPSAPDPAAAAPGAPAASVPVANAPVANAPVASAAAPQHAPAQPAFPTWQAQLANGLRVILAPDRTLPTVTVVVRYEVGSRDEPDGLSGLAHLVEHLTFQGSRHVPKGALFRLLLDAGATDLNGETSSDTTIYHETVPPERLELALWLESDRMGFFLDALDESSLSQERRVVKAEVNERYVDQPLGIMPLVVAESTFPSWHPYHLAPAGEEEDLPRITLEDVRAFFTTWYGPANATLILTGNFDEMAAAPLVRRYFETLPGRPPPARPTLPQIQRRGPTRVEIEASTIEEEAALTWVTPAYGAPGDAALDLVASLLVGAETSRLQKRLVGDGLARNVRAGQSSRMLASVFSISVVGAPGKHAEEIRDAVDQELSRLATFGPSEAEMSRVRGYWSDRDLFRLESSLSRASRLASVSALGPIQTPFDWLDRRRAGLTAADVRDAVTRYLSPGARAAEVLCHTNRKQPLAGVVVRREEP